MQKDDVIRLRHMLDAAREAVGLAAGKSCEDIERERTLNLSLVRLVEVIGEAATHVSAEYREKYPSIPWAQIIGMRNRLIHGYYDIDFDVLYQTVNQDIPPLIAGLERIISKESR